MTTKPKTVTLREANAMQRALGNSIDAPDAMEALFPDGHQRQAAYRAAVKLDDAIGEALYQ